MPSDVVGTVNVPLLVKTCMFEKPLPLPLTQAEPLDTIDLPAFPIGDGKPFGKTEVGRTEPDPVDTTPASNVPASKIKLPDVG
jgi:hypothetical protein